jgi:hypothetical protein
LFGQVWLGQVGSGEVRRGRRGKVQVRNGAVRQARTGVKSMSYVVFDALERLERLSRRRLSSENSKTTAKLISAAAEVGAVVGRAAKAGERILISYHDEARYFEYEIRQQKLFNSAHQQFVDANREVAFVFACDIAAGLLYVIIKNIEKKENVMANVVKELNLAWISRHGCCEKCGQARVLAKRLKSMARLSPKESHGGVFGAVQ